MTARLIRLFGIVSLLCVLPATASAVCSTSGGIAMKKETSTTLNVALKIKPGTIPVSAPFQVEITVCDRPARFPTRVTLDAVMPLHQHGMNYKPNVRKLASGRYLADGLLFHMPGLWRFEVAAYLDGRPHRFTHDLHVE